MQCSHSDAGSGSAQCVPRFTPASRLRLHQDKAVVEEGLCSPSWGGKRAGAISFHPWKMSWRPFAGVFFDITQSGLHLAMGNPFCSYHFSLLYLLSLCSFPAVPPGSNYQNDALCAARASWCSERSKGRKRVKECGAQSESPALFTWQFPAHSETMLCIFCPTQCTFPWIQTPGCIVPYILANQCQIFYSVFIPLVNRKMDSTVSCYLPTMFGLPWGKEEYFYSSRQSSLEKKKSFHFQKIWGSKSLLYSG